MKYKGFEVDDKKIDEYTEKLDCTIAEACELILEESGKIEESDETTKAIESIKVTRRYEKSDKERKKSTKERKVDDEKKFLLGCVKVLLDGLEGADVTAVKTETEINFTYGASAYTFKLTKHRPPKKQVVGAWAPGQKIFLTIQKIFDIIYLEDEK